MFLAGGVSPCHFLIYNKKYLLEREFLPRFDTAGLVSPYPLSYNRVIGRKAILHE